MAEETDTEEEEEELREITEDDFDRLISYDKGKKKFIADCPVEGCNKHYEIGSKGFVWKNFRKHLRKEHGIEVVPGKKEEGGTGGEGGIFQRVSPIPEKIQELLSDYAGVDKRVTSKIVELLEKNPVLTENPNNLFNFLSRARGLDPTLAKNIVDIVFSQIAYEQQLKNTGGVITPVFPQTAQNPIINPIGAGSGGAISPQTSTQSMGSTPQVAYVQTPGGGMTPVIVIPQQVTPSSGNSTGGSLQPPAIKMPPAELPSTRDDRIQWYEERIRRLEERLERVGAAESNRRTEQLPSNIAMRKTREPIFAKNEDGSIIVNKKTGKPVVLEWREIEEPVVIGPQMPTQSQPDEGRRGVRDEDPVTTALTILERAKGIFSSPSTQGTGTTPTVDEEKLLMKAREQSVKEAEERVRSLEAEVDKVKQVTSSLHNHINDRMSEIKDLIKDMQHENEKKTIAEQAARATYERLQPFLSRSEQTTPPGLSPQQFAMAQVRQLADTMIHNLRAGFDSLGQRLDKFVDAQKVSQMATSLLSSGIPPDQVERIIFQYVRAQMTPEAVEEAARYTSQGVDISEKEAFLNKLRGSVT